MRKSKEFISFVFLFLMEGYMIYRLYFNSDEMEARYYWGFVVATPILGLFLFLAFAVLIFTRFVKY